MSGKITRCYFCGGNISSGYCIMCGRSDNIAHELYVMEEQKKPHKNWNTCKEETERLSRQGMGNPDGYGRRNLNRVGKVTAKNCREVLHG